MLTAGEGARSSAPKDLAAYLLAKASRPFAVQCDGPVVEIADQVAMAVRQPDPPVAFDLAAVGRKGAMPLPLTSRTGTAPNRPDDVPQARDAGRDRVRRNRPETEAYEAFVG